MKTTSIVGILLVVAGALALAYQGITYTKHEDVLDIGPIHATADRQERIPLPPMLGAGWRDCPPGGRIKAKVIKKISAGD